MPRRGCLLVWLQVLVDELANRGRAADALRLGEVIQLGDLLRVEGDAADDAAVNGGALVFRVGPGGGVHMHTVAHCAYARQVACSTYAYAAPNLGEWSAERRTPTPQTG